MAVVVGTLVGGLALVCLPLVGLLIAANYLPTGYIILLAPFPVMWSAMNLSNLVAAAVFLIIALAMLTHRVIWAVIGRPLEVVVAEHVLMKRGPLLFAGLAALGASWGGVAFIVKVLRGG